MFLDAGCSGVFATLRCNPRILSSTQHNGVSHSSRRVSILRLLLAIESSCDETSAAVVAEDRRVLSNVVASQFELHQEFGGVVPEIASRAHVRRILPVLDEALSRADCRLGDLSAIAVTSEPGLVGSLLVGFTAAKTLAMSLNVPLFTVNHIDAHIYACGMGGDPRRIRRSGSLLVVGIPIYTTVDQQRTADYSQGPPMMPLVRRLTRWPEFWVCPIRAGRQFRQLQNQETRMPSNCRDR